MLIICDNVPMRMSIAIALDLRIRNALTLLARMLDQAYIGFR